MSARFAIVPARAVEDQRLGNAALRVLCCLGTYSDKDGWCRPSLRTLAARLMLSRQTTAEHLTTLCGLGYVEISRRERPDGGNASNEYRLLFDRALLVVRETAEGEQEQPAPPVSEIPTGGCRTSRQGGAGPAEHLSGSEPDTLSGSEPAPILKNAPIERTDSPSLRDDQTARQFETFWQIYPSRRPHNNPRKPALTKFELAVKRGVDPAAIIAGAEQYRAYVEREHIEHRYIKQAVTWLSQECWTESHEVPEPQQPAVGWM